ncbi:hypothetical protein [Flavobacterium caeni]|uniref:DUF4468 domain-containing protein n=1 Tax=Flavobacterium caeni TaxID=490189 RepID=A0A1G5GW35_9FLAO|nr:hypothetical protein [Flavobacterium caeni]SCY55704.1 hypothetical protein SAMN02927903_01650 [Flavobacterium caeni]
MKRLLLLLLFSSVGHAQASFEALDSLSVVVSKWQAMTEGTTYKDASGQLQTLSFPEENFQIWFADRMASKAVFKKTGDTEVLALTENIDLSKATGISVSDNYFGVAYIQLDFPEGHLKTQLYENGELKETVGVNRLEFFCRYGALDPNKKFYFDLMFDMVYALCNMMKVEKGLTNVDTIRTELTDWNKLSAAAFLAKHPNSLMATQAKLNLKEAEKKD